MEATSLLAQIPQAFQKIKKEETTKTKKSKYEYLMNNL